MAKLKRQWKGKECQKPLRYLQEVARIKCNACYDKQFEAEAKADARTELDYK